ncbi:MAG: ArnT family glycosyltransferase [Phycisphaerae bacterium]
MLVFACLGFYLPGIQSLPPLDGDESRYAEASREMSTSGDLQAWVVPHILGVPRLNKPPLAYWLQAGVARCLSQGNLAKYEYPAALKAETSEEVTRTGSPKTRSGVFAGAIWMFRMPSVLATIVAVLITWRLGIAMFGGLTGWLGAALLAGCFLVVTDTRLARTDQLLLACTVAAQWSLWHLWRSKKATLGWSIGFWTAIALGVMTKGPVTPAVAILTILMLGALSGDWRILSRVRWPIGALVLCAIIVPWLGLAASALGWAPLREVVWREIWVRTMSAEASRAGPPGYHAVLLFGLFWPGALLVVPGMMRAYKRGIRGRRTFPARQNKSAQSTIGLAKLREYVAGGRSAEFFCLAWIVPAWLVCELLESKLPHYTLPLYPPIALLCARAAYAGQAGRLPLAGTKSAFWGDLAWLIVGGGLFIGVSTYFARSGGLQRDAGVLLALLASVIVTTTLLVCAWHVVRRQKFVLGLLVALGVSAVGSRMLFQVVMPNIDKPWLSSRIVSTLSRIDPEGKRPKAAVGFHHESLLFLTGGRIERVNSQELPAWLAANPQGLVIMAAEKNSPDIRLHEVAQVAGFDFVSGDHVVLAIAENMEHTSSLMP